MGSPGYLDFTGSIIKESNTEDLIEIEKLLGDSDLKRRLPTLNSYFGYSVSSGIFTEDKQEYIVIGAPRNDYYNGKVFNQIKNLSSK